MQATHRHPFGSCRQLFRKGIALLGTSLRHSTMECCHSSPRAPYHAPSVCRSVTVTRHISLTGTVTCNCNCNSHMSQSLSQLHIPLPVLVPMELSHVTLSQCHGHTHSESSDSYLVTVLPTFNGFPNSQRHGPLPTPGVGPTARNSRVLLGPREPSTGSCTTGTTVGAPSGPHCTKVHTSTSTVRGPTLSAVYQLPVVLSPDS